MTRRVLFVQAGEAGTHDEWDDKLVESLRLELGNGFEARYPRMPDEDDPGHPELGLRHPQEIESLDAGAVVVGHSVGATILIHALEDHTLPDRSPRSGCSAAPFVENGERLGQVDENVQLVGSTRLSAAACAGPPVYGEARDDTVPPAHAELRPATSEAEYTFKMRDHQLGNTWASWRCDPGLPAVGPRPGR